MTFWHSSDYEKEHPWNIPNLFLVLEIHVFGRRDENSPVLRNPENANIARLDNIIRQDFSSGKPQFIWLWNNFWNNQAVYIWFLVTCFFSPRTSEVINHQNRATSTWDKAQTKMLLKQFFLLIFERVICFKAPTYGTITILNNSADLIRVILTPAISWDYYEQRTNKTLVRNLDKAIGGNHIM